LLRLLRLPKIVLDHVSRGTLTVGHVKVLLGLPEVQILELAHRIASDGWSVRQVEEWVAEAAKAEGRRHRGRRITRGVPKTDHIQRIEQDLCRKFATDARIRFARGGGRIEIRFHDEEDLSRLLDLLGVIVV
jgi:ParB family chromosome partitioning protein